MIAITANLLFTPLDRIERPLVLVEDGVIAEVTSRAQRDVPGNCCVVDFGDAVAQWLTSRKWKPQGAPLQILDVYRTRYRTIQCFNGKWKIIPLR